MPIRYARKLNKFDKLDLHSIGLIMKRFYEMAIESFGLFHAISILGLQFFSTAESVR